MCCNLYEKVAASILLILRLRADAYLPPSVFLPSNNPHQDAAASVLLADGHKGLQHIMRLLLVTCVSGCRSAESVPSGYLCRRCCGTCTDRMLTAGLTNGWKESDIVLRRETQRKLFRLESGDVHVINCRNHSAVHPFQHHSEASHMAGMRCRSVLLLVALCAGERPRLSPTLSQLPSSHRHSVMQSLLPARGLQLHVSSHHVSGTHTKAACILLLQV